MWLGIGYLIPMKGDKAGEPLPSIDLIISEAGDTLQMEANTNNMIPESA
tara:strand:+ start:963 stop:1109 length:147 start_codon:yes stop_codon:yes gene_type:complete